MNDVISIEEIQNTKTFKGLNDIRKQFIVKRANREVITNALIVYKGTGVIPGNIQGYNIELVEELCKKDN